MRIVWEMKTAMTRASSRRRTNVTTERTPHAAVRLRVRPHLGSNALDRGVATSFQLQLVVYADAIPSLSGDGK